MRKVRTIAALAFLALLSAARPATPQLQGTYQSDCAPYDGPAFLITLPAPAQRGEFWLRANVPLAEIAGNWPHAMDSRPGTASIVLCRKTPDQICDYPEAGTFTVTGKPGAQISGSFDARFKSGIRHTYRFTAEPVRGGERMLCG